MAKVPGSTQSGLVLGGAWSVFKVLTRPPELQPEAKTFTPPQWQRPQLTSITVDWPVQSVAHRITDDQGHVIDEPPPTLQYVTITYFFDAVFRVDHSQRLQRTEHPVQTGIPVTDHAYLLPARVTLDVGMSDAMSVLQQGVYTSDQSKSVSAYQTLLKLQRSRLPLTLATRLHTYTNMLIEGIETSDDLRTRYGLRATVSLGQIQLGFLATRTVSARPHQTDVTHEGTKQPLPVPPEMMVSHKLTEEGKRVLAEIRAIKSGSAIGGQKIPGYDPPKWNFNDWWSSNPLGISKPEDTPKFPGGSGPF